MRGYSLITGFISSELARMEAAVLLLYQIQRRKMLRAGVGERRRVVRRHISLSEERVLSGLCLFVSFLWREVSLRVHSPTRTYVCTCMRENAIKAFTRPARHGS